MNDDNQNSGFPMKLMQKLNKIQPNFADGAEQLTDDELKSRLIEYQKAIGQHEKDMENDTKLLGYKEQVKELSAIYREPIAEFKLMIKYLLYVMESRGL